MRPIKFKRIEIRRPKWDPHPEKSTTNNHNWRVGMFIIFEDYYGNEFDCMLKWSDLNEINQKRLDVEEKNRILCKQYADQDCSEGST